VPTWSQTKYPNSRLVVATILAGDSISNVVSMAGLILYAIEVPAAFLGPAVSLSLRQPGGAPFDLYSSEGDEVLLIVTSAGIIVGVDQQKNELLTMRLASDIQIRAGSASAPVAQAVDVDIILHGSIYPY
jgi:hypothetical protein